MVAPKVPERPAISVAQATEFGMGQMDGATVKGSPNIVVLGKGSASIPLTPSITVGASRRGRHNERDRGAWSQLGVIPGPDVSGQWLAHAGQAPAPVDKSTGSGIDALHP